MNDLPQLPAGFQLEASGPPPLPEGFVPEQPHASGLGATALDVAKQLGTGVATGIESIPGTMPSLIGLAGEKLGPLIEKYAPWLATADPTAEANRKFLSDQGQKLRADSSIANYLPQPETKAGEAARMVGNFLPSGLGMSGSLVKNAVASTAAGLGAFGGGEIAPNENAKPYYEMAGALVGGPAALRTMETGAARSARVAVPSTADTLKAADQGYNTARRAAAAEPITQNTLDIVADDMKRTLNAAGQRPSNMGKIHDAIEEIRTPGTPDKPDMADLVAGRQAIKAFFQNPLPDPNKAGAFTALGRIDAAIEQLSPETMATLRRADANFSAGKTSEGLDKRIARAEMRTSGADSGMNLGNKIRQNAASMLLSNKESRYLTDAEKSGLTSVNKGTTTQNLMRFGSNLLGGGGGMYTGMLAAGGLYGASEGHPEGLALPLAGLGLRFLANRSIANQAANVGAQIRSRSPFAQSLGVSGPGPQLTKKQAAALAALYAMPATRGILSPALSNN